MLCSRLSSCRDFSSASGFGLNLAFAACCQLSVCCDPGDAQSPGRAAAGGTVVLLTWEPNRVGFIIYCLFVKSSPVQEPGHPCWAMRFKAGKF